MAVQTDLPGWTALNQVHNPADGSNRSNWSNPIRPGQTSLSRADPRFWQPYITTVLRTINTANRRRARTNSQMSVCAGFYYIFIGIHRIVPRALRCVQGTLFLYTIDEYTTYLHVEHHDSCTDSTQQLAAQLGDVIRICVQSCRLVSVGHCCLCVGIRPVVTAAAATLPIKHLWRCRFFTHGLAINRTEPPNPELRSIAAHNSM